jgi:hypothetical protein
MESRNGRTTYTIVESPVTGTVRVAGNSVTVIREFANQLPFEAYRLRIATYNIEDFYMVIILRLCFLYGSQNKQQPYFYRTSTEWILLTGWSVYCAVRTESLYNTDTFRLKRLNLAEI